MGSVVKPASPLLVSTMGRKTDEDYGNGEGNITRFKKLPECISNIHDYIVVIT